MNAINHPIATSDITLAEAERVSAYAKRQGNVHIQFAALAVIDALNGEPDFWRDLAYYEDELFELIEDRRDNPNWYAALRGALS